MGNTFKKIDPDYCKNVADEALSENDRDYGSISFEARIAYKKFRQIEILNRPLIKEKGKHILASSCERSYYIDQMSKVYGEIIK